MKTKYKVVKENGDTRWYNLDGKCHRTDGPAIERSDGSSEWWIDGKVHRTDGPATERFDGTKKWYIDDKLHRTDGPAIEYFDGAKSWFINGKSLTESEFLARTNKQQDSIEGKIVEIGGKKYRLVESK